MKVYELLADPKAWIKENIAMNEKGFIVDARHSDAVCWCLMGGVYKIYGYDGEGHVIRMKIKKVIRVDPTSWNDVPERTHEEVISLCKELDI
jgi:hypothetical protein